MAENKLTAAKINKLRKEIKGEATINRIGVRTTSPKQLTFGRYPDLSVAEARKKRDNCRQWLAEGSDPAIELKLGEAKTPKPISLWDAVNYWIENYAIDNRKNVLINEQQLDKWIPDKV
ncbi:Arm DNA-binding domain-containing protein [Shewanella canadensis]|nr:Arm DNA-binding domain-containing protein [Shewanella canadensis]